MLEAKSAASEHEIEALVDYTFRKNGGTGPGYPTIVGGGANATIRTTSRTGRRWFAGNCCSSTRAARSTATPPT